MGERTIVLDIPILDNEERNEYSYLDLVEAQLKLNPTSLGLNESNDSKLEALAKSLEKKYGQMLTINKKGKKKRVRVDDFIDHGEGYDSQDSFIDDSEATELVVAPTMSTKYGGFFINEGPLDSIEDQSMSIEMSPDIPKKFDQKKDKRHVLKKDKSKQLLERAVKQLSSPAATITQKNNLHSLDSTFDAVLAQHADENKKELPNGVNPQAKNSQTTATSPVTKPPPKSKTTGPCVLPRLPPKLLAAVQHIIVFKPETPPTGRWSLPPQFDTELLRFEHELQEYRVLKSLRSGVYAYLEEKFGLKRKSLITRLRKLQEVKCESKLEPMLVSLKDAISKAMPDIIATYKRDMASYQERLSTWEIEKVSNTELKRPGAPKKIFKWSSDCKALLDRIVAFRMETAYTALGKCVDEEQIKRFLNTLIPLWPDSWISIAALWRASLSSYHRMKSKLISNSVSSAPQTNSTNTKVSGANVVQNSPPKPLISASEAAANTKPTSAQQQATPNHTSSSSSNVRHANPTSVAPATVLTTNVKEYNNVFHLQFNKPKVSTSSHVNTIDLTSDVDMHVKTPTKAQLPPTSSFSPPSISSVVKSPLTTSSPVLTITYSQNRLSSVVPTDKSAFYTPQLPVGRNSYVSPSASSSSSSSFSKSPSQSTPTTSSPSSTAVMQQISKATGVPIATLAAIGNSPNSIQAMVALYQQKQQQRQQQFIALAQNSQQQQQQRQVVSQPNWSSQQVQGLRRVLTQQSPSKQLAPAVVSVAPLVPAAQSPQNSSPFQTTTAAQMRQVQQQLLQHQQINQQHYQNVRHFQLQPNNLQNFSSNNSNGSVNRNGK